MGLAGALASVNTPSSPQACRTLLSSDWSSPASFASDRCRQGCSSFSPASTLVLSDFI